LKIQAAVKYLVRRCETSSQEAFKRRFKRFKATIQQLTIRRQEDEESEEKPSSEAIKAEDQQYLFRESHTVRHKTHSKLTKNEPARERRPMATEPPSTQRFKKDDDQVYY